MLVPIWTMPRELGSSVDVISSARAHRRQRITVTWMGGRCDESMLCRTDDREEELEERSESDAE
jgi:hypothetical protein